MVRYSSLIVINSVIVTTAPPIEPNPQFVELLYLYSTVNANQ